MNTTTALILRLLLMVATASMGSCLGDQCSVVHYLAAGEARDFSFRSGSQFMDNLNCIFSFSAPSDHYLTVAVSDLDMAPPSDGSCDDDVLTIYDLTGGQLQATSSYCGNNATLNQEIVLSTNIAVVSFVSHESSTPRRFTLILKTVQQMQKEQQNGSTHEGQKEVETVTDGGEGNGEDKGAGEEETGGGEQEIGGREEETGGGEQETGGREEETGRREEETLGGEEDTGGREEETGKGEEETGGGEQEIGRREEETGGGEEGTGGREEETVGETGEGGRGGGEGEWEGEEEGEWEGEEGEEDEELP